MNTTKQLADKVGVRRACETLVVSRASYYRYHRRAEEGSSSRQRPRPPLALSEAERDTVLETLHSPRFIDQSPHTVHATLLDEGKYLASPRTMYRLLEQHDEVHERRRGHQRTNHAKPELLATAPNQLWSWDITKLKGAQTWTYFYLYVILDVFSRYVVGWMVAHRETAQLATELIKATIEKQAIEPGQLTIHADRGSSMRSKPVAFLLADLGVTKTHSRPSVSNDNPYSEAQFKTFKYHLEFPERFGSIEHARDFSRNFFPWYNDEHRHSGLAYLTPADVHYGRTDERLQTRQQALDAAFLAHPNRFKGRPPKAAQPSAEVWINKPTNEQKQTDEIQQ